jgi:hypothetical protein
MFGIEWLRNGVPVHKETSVLTSAAAAIAAAKSRGRLVADRHPEPEPDSFRLTDATGKIIGVFPASWPASTKPIGRVDLFGRLKSFFSRGSVQRREDSTAGAKRCSPPRSRCCLSKSRAGSR